MRIYLCTVSDSSYSHPHSLSLVLDVMMKSKDLKTRFPHAHSLIISTYDTSSKHISRSVVDTGGLLAPMFFAISSIIGIGGVVVEILCTESSSAGTVALVLAIMLPTAYYEVSVSCFVGASSVGTISVVSSFTTTSA